MQLNPTHCTFKASCRSCCFFLSMLGGWGGMSNESRGWGLLARGLNERHLHQAQHIHVHCSEHDICEQSKCHLTLLCGILVRQRIIRRTNEWQLFMCPRTVVFDAILMICSLWNLNYSLKIHGLGYWRIHYNVLCVHSNLLCIPICGRPCRKIF